MEKKLKMYWLAFKYWVGGASWGAALYAAKWLTMCRTFGGRDKDGKN